MIEDAEKEARKRAQRLHPHNEFKLKIAVDKLQLEYINAFKSGVTWEREHIIALLRSDEAKSAQWVAPDMWANWLEEKLK